ncbi:hypothetical protein IP88_14110 [alpha proteobacterium AAP81b]|nr:hypothetical protein IP88_14110 [alpha proteobacterium AAP81b]
MHLRPLLFAAAVAVAGTGTAAANAAPATPAASMAPAEAMGVVHVRSNHGFDETLARLKAAIAAKGVRFFDAIDQQAFGAEAGLPIGRSTIVRFGNPPLGVQFLQANRYAGLDWPVRMLVVEAADGSVSLAWTDFGFMARRYAITGLDAQFKMAADVAASIAADAAGPGNE